MLFIFKILFVVTETQLLILFRLWYSPLFNVYPDQPCKVGRAITKGGSNREKSNIAIANALCVSVITVSLSLLSIFLSGVSHGRFRPC